MGPQVEGVRQATSDATSCEAVQYRYCGGEALSGKPFDATQHAQRDMRWTRAFGRSRVAVRGATQ